MEVAEVTLLAEVLQSPVVAAPVFPLLAAVLKQIPSEVVEVGGFRTFLGSVLASFDSEWLVAVVAVAAAAVVVVVEQTAGLVAMGR